VESHFSSQGKTLFACNSATDAATSKSADLTFAIRLHESGPPSSQSRPISMDLFHGKINLIDGKLPVAENNHSAHTNICTPDSKHDKSLQYAKACFHLLAL
jgi:hypothetical protein